MFFEYFLCLIRTIERLAISIFAGPGVITSYDEVGATVVLSN